MTAVQLGLWDFAEKTLETKAKVGGGVRRPRRKKEADTQGFFGFAYDVRAALEVPRKRQRPKKRYKPKPKPTLEGRIRNPPLHPVTEFTHPDNHIAGVRVDLNWSLNQARARWLGGCLSDGGYIYYRERWMKHNGWGIDEDLPDDTQGDVDCFGTTRFSGLINDED